MEIRLNHILLTFVDFICYYDICIIENVTRRGGSFVMLKAVFYFNVLFFGLTSIFLCKYSFSKNAKFNWAMEAVALLVLSLLNLILIGKCVDIGWNFLLIDCVFLVTEILYIISFIKFLLSKKVKSETPALPAVIALIAVPVVLFVASYTYELFRLNTCDYLVKYNYQNGIIISNDTYFAVSEHKPAKVSLINNLFNRKSTSEYTGIATYIQCNIYFSDNGEMELRTYNDRSKVYESIFEALGSAIISENPETEYIEIKHIPEENDAIVRFRNSGDYLYHDNERIGKFNAKGDLDEVIVY